MADVTAQLAPTFRDITAMSKNERRNSADDDTWIRVVKPCRRICLHGNLNVADINVGELFDSGANTGLQGSDMRMLHQEHGSVAVVVPSNVKWCRA